MQFATSRLNADNVPGRTVLELGAFNVNGSIRAHVEALGPARYHGVDMREGPGVDQVCDATALPFDAGSWDIVVCTEMLEHVRDWRAAVREMSRVLAPQGLLLLTTRSVGFPLHEYPGDYWRFGVDDALVIFGGFRRLAVIPDPQVPGIFVWATGPGGGDLVDLDAVNVYAMPQP